MNGLPEQYSGIVLNQNQTATSSYAWRTNGGNWIYQTFVLPSDFIRGPNQVPDLAGFQILVHIDHGFAPAASLNYVCQAYQGDTDIWQTLASGTMIGAHAHGQVWYDVFFDSTVPIPFSLLTTKLRIGVQIPTTQNNPILAEVVISEVENTYIIAGQPFTAVLVEGVPHLIMLGGLPAFLLKRNGVVTYSYQQGIAELLYVSPTPLGSALQAYAADGTTILLGNGNSSACLNFRILALVADSGKNFLNNEYRSAVIQTQAGNTSSTGGNSPVSGSGSSSYWMSPPQPSRFAVQSLYFDVRPVTTTPVFGNINYMGNPSFEWDAVGHAPQWWQAFANGGTATTQAVSTGWSFDRVQSLNLNYTFSAASQQLGIISPFQQIAATTNGQPTPISLSVEYSTTSITNASLVLSALFYDSTQTLLPSPYGTTNFSTIATSTGMLSGTTTAPANAVYVKYMVSVLSSGAGSYQGYIDAIQVTFTGQVIPYFDGDDIGYQWTAQRGQSASAQVVETAPDDNFVVIDGVLVDPLMPNMSFNIYYSVDDAYTSTNMVDADWEQKLWTRVPKVYVATQRQQYVLPHPIHAKYVKVEFTNLQSRPYDPGNFAKPVLYKKYPTWVANYFLAQLEIESIIAGQVNVQYDALSFAYDYYLDDLNQSPNLPVVPPTSALGQLTDYFSQAATTGVDPTTLAQINLAMKPFQYPLGHNVDTNTALGAMVSSILSSPSSIQVSEGGNLPLIDYSTVSSLNRESVMFEQSLPVMYFFVTCRHTYKELYASFTQHRAYFAGVNEVAFIRNDYTVAADTPLYIESGGDAANITLMDWTVEDNIWFAY